VPSKKPVTGSTKDSTQNTDNKSSKLDGTLKEKVLKLLELTDDQYSDRLLDSETRGFLLDVEKEFLTATASYKTHIAPSYREVQ